MSNAKSRYRRRRRAAFAAIRDAESERRWREMGGIDGWLRLRYPDPERLSALSLRWGRS